MALLKYRDNDGNWTTIYHDVMLAVKNRLRCDKNLGDVKDVTEARANLGLAGDNNHTHYHDDRYLEKIRNVKKELEESFQDFKNKIQRDVANMISLISSKLQELSDNNTQMRNDIEDFKRFVFKKGMIIDWYGTADNIPAGWHLCDGTNGTPDLRDRFVLGAGGDFPLEAKGGNASIKLTVDMIPEHRHTIFAGGGTDWDNHWPVAIAVQTTPDYVSGTVITNGVYNEKSPIGNSAGSGGRRSTDTGERKNSPYRKGANGTGANSNGGVVIGPESVEQQADVKVMPPYCALFKIMKL